MPDGVSPRMAGETMSSGDVERHGPTGRDPGGLVHRIFSFASGLGGGRALQFALQYVVIPWGAGFFLGRAIILDTLHPFGKAFVVSLAASGHRGRALAAAFGVLYAALSSPSGSAVDSPASILIFVWLFAAVAGRLFNLSPWVSASGAMLGAATLGVVAAGFSGENVIIAGIVGAVDMAAMALLLPITRQLFRPLRRPAVKKWTGAYVASLLVFVSLLLPGTVGMEVAGYSVHGVALRIFVVVGALVGGAGGGAIAGTLLGLLTVLTDAGALWEAVLIAATGLGAGLGVGLLGMVGGQPMYPRIGSLLGLFVVHLLLASLAPNGQNVLAGMLHSVLAGGVVVFIPEVWLERGRRQLGRLSEAGTTDQRGQLTAGWREPMLRLADALARAAAALGGVRVDASYGLSAAGGVQAESDGETVPEESLWAAPDYGGYVSFPSAGKSVPASDDGEGDAGKSARTFAADDTDTNILESRDGFDRFVTDVRQRVCRGCSHETVCWETYGWQTYRDLLAFVTDALPDEEDGEGPRVVPGRLPHELRQRCIQLQHFSMGVEKLLALVYNRARHEQQLHRWQAPLQRQLNGLAEIIAMTADEISRLERRRDELMDEEASASNHPRFQLQTDHVHVPGDESVLSGDFFRQVNLPDDRVAFIVCDGMGSGARAAAESRAVTEMLGRFLEVGFELRFCVQTMNAVMLLRAAAESFVTVDVTVVNLRDGTMHVAKTGAAPTYIHRGNEVEMIRADSLPVGILPSVEVFEAQKQLNMGDVVVMMTDGALELGAARGDKGELVRRHMARLERPRPKQVVDSLFSRGRRSEGQPLPDDVTIVATQLFPKVIGQGNTF